MYTSSPIFVNYQQSSRGPDSAIQYSNSTMETSNFSSSGGFFSNFILTSYVVTFLLTLTLPV